MCYLVIGNGKLARHLCHYFKLLNITYYNWHYRNNEHSKIALNSYIEQILSHEKQSRENLRILVVIKDSEIDRFILEHININHYKNIFHCSGALVSQYSIGIHPLMTFSNDLYDLETYKNIPFVTFKNHSIKHFFKHLPNNFYPIKQEHQKLYHALCVMLGNFSQILWQKANNTMHQELGLPKNISELYLKKNLDNYLQSPDFCLTGPLARNDQTTITKNLTALQEYNTTFSNLYLKFIEIYHDKT